MGDLILGILHSDLEHGVVIILVALLLCLLLLLHKERSFFLLFHLALHLVNGFFNRHLTFLVGVVLEETCLQHLGTFRALLGNNCGHILWLSAC